MRDQDRKFIDIEAYDRQGECDETAKAFLDAVDFNCSGHSSSINTDSGRNINRSFAVPRKLRLSLYLLRRAVDHFVYPVERGQCCQIIRQMNVAQRLSQPCRLSPPM